MRILQVTGDLYPYTMGGIGVVVDNLSRYLLEKSMKVDILTFEFHENTGEKTPYKIMKYKYQISIFGNKISIPMFLDLIKKRNAYDVIHAHSHLFYPTLVCAVARKIGKFKLVVTNHGCYSQTAPLWLSKIWLVTFGKFIFKTADKIICLTESDRNMLIKLGINASKIKTIPNGVDSKQFVPDKTKIKDSRLLFVGRLVLGKGVKKLVLAFEKILTQIPSARLVIVGQGPEEDEIRRSISEKGLEKSVELKSNLSKDELIEEYQKSCIFVLPSTTEGMPMTILEAMACGKPIITTANLPELVGKAGIIIPNASADELAQSILKIYSDKQKIEEMGNCARKIIEEKYAKDRRFDEILQLYFEMVAA